MSFLPPFVDRKKRLAEMREFAKVRKYGSVIPISGSDFVREVSQASLEIWVVVILYKDGYVEHSTCFKPLKDQLV